MQDTETTYVYKNKTSVNQRKVQVAHVKQNHNILQPSSGQEPESVMRDSVEHETAVYSDTSQYQCQWHCPTITYN